MSFKIGRNIEIGARASHFGRAELNIVQKRIDSRVTDVRVLAQIVGAVEGTVGLTAFETTVEKVVRDRLQS